METCCSTCNHSLVHQTGNSPSSLSNWKPFIFQMSRKRASYELQSPCPAADAIRHKGARILSSESIQSTRLSKHELNPFQSGNTTSILNQMEHLELTSSSNRRKKNRKVKFTSGPQTCSAMSYQSLNSQTCSVVLSRSLKLQITHLDSKTCFVVSYWSLNS